MSQNQVWSGQQNIGGKSQKYPSRKFIIQAKDFTSAEQATPVRVIFGTTRIAGAYITPIFGFRNKAITQKIAK